MIFTYKAEAPGRPAGAPANLLLWRSSPGVSGGEQSSSGNPRQGSVRGVGEAGRAKPRAAVPPASAKSRLGPAPHPGEPQQRARRVPCGHPHQPPTSPRSPGGAPGPARGRRRSASCGGRQSPHGPSRSLTTRPRARHAASARPVLARAPRRPCPARRRPSVSRELPRARAAPRPQRALPAAPSGRAEGGAGAVSRL